MEVFGIRVMELFPVILFFVSIFVLITTSSAVKSIVFLLVLNSAVIIYWIALGSRAGIVPPILETDYSLAAHFYEFSDPVPQALMVTAIIIGFCVTAITIIMVNTLHRRYRTTNWDVLFVLAREEVERDKEKTLSDIVYSENNKRGQ